MHGLTNFKPLLLLCVCKVTLFICHNFLVAFTSYLPKYAYTKSFFFSLKEGILLLDLHADICNY
jgi:hypothetical protein